MRPGWPGEVLRGCTAPGGESNPQPQRHRGQHAETLVAGAVGAVRRRPPDRRLPRSSRWQGGCACRQRARA
eukprot:1934014-Alexandrium_andersonii.AAC.1